MSRIDYKLFVDSDFIIGTGAGTLSSDDKTIWVKDQDDKVVLTIPGSTIKGLVRWEAAALCDFLGIPTCDGKLGKNNTLCGIHTTTICPLCAIFGSNLYPSVFHFSTPEVVKLRDNNTCRRAFNAIDPQTGTVKDSALFFLEMARGGEFTGWIEQFGPLPEPLNGDDKIKGMISTILKASLGMVRAIGGGKSRGHGECRFAEIPWPTEQEIEEVKTWPS